MYIKSSDLDALLFKKVQNNLTARKDNLTEALDKLFCRPSFYMYAHPRPDLPDKQITFGKNLSRAPCSAKILLNRQDLPEAIQKELESYSQDLIEQANIEYMLSAGLIALANTCIHPSPPYSYLLLLPHDFVEEVFMYKNIGSIILADFLLSDASTLTFLYKGHYHTFEEMAELDWVKNIYSTLQACMVRRLLM